MASERSPKRVKTSPDTEDTVKHVIAAPILSPTGQTDPVTQPDNASEAPSKQGQRSSWYNRTWPRKAAPVTQVAKESISSASIAATEAIAVVAETASLRSKSVRSGSLQMALGKSKASRASLADVATTKIHATPEAAKPSQKASIKSELGDQPQIRQNGTIAATTEPQNSDKGKEVDKTDEPSTDKLAGKVHQHQKSLSMQEIGNASATWLAWFSKQQESDRSSLPAAPEIDAAKAADSDQVSKPGLKQSAASAELPRTENQTTATELDHPAASQGGSKRGWLQIWAGDNATKPSTPPVARRQPDSSEATNESADSKLLVAPEAAPKLSAPNSKASSIEMSPPPPLPGDVSKSSGWVFWSRDHKESTSLIAEDRPHVGEIAISDTPSQKRPKRASISLAGDKNPPVVDVKPKKEAPERPDSPAPSLKATKASKASDPKANKASSLKEGKSVDMPKGPETTRAESSSGAAPAKASMETSKKPVHKEAAKRSDNLLLPSLKDTFTLQENPSILEQIGRLLNYTKASETKHLSIVRDPPRIKNVLAIGVHGYFPAPLIRSVLGQPTGTSIKFADMAAKSIQRWTQSRGYDCQVRTAALEGEGKIAERIELLWKLLLNWIDEIRKADFVMVACHSQGVPVAIMLVAKLIQFGCVSSARVGVCAMAGVSMGPFPEFKSRWISGSAGELFEFSDPASKVSGDYLAALEIVLGFGVRLCFVGSIDDQLVSLESSLYTPISHPHIYRAVQIDSRVHAPNFLSHLVGFALKLRNLGVPDHGLIRELSSPLAGSLYTGEGHSRIYDDDAVYDLAVAFALETNSVGNVGLTQRPNLSSGANPYILPFAMRGILEEDYVKTELQSEAAELLKQFDDWKPTTKVLKDVKFRLEGIRSKL